MTKKKLKRYKKLIISHDCLVPKGAMQVESVFKEEKEGLTTFTKRKTYEDLVVKFDDEKQIMYNILVKWNKSDSDDWILDKENIRRDTMIDYQQNGDKVLKFTHLKDKDGEPYSIDAHVMEFFFVKENDPIYPDYIGSIARSAYFKDKEEFDFIKELEFESSIEGKAWLEEFEVEDVTAKEKTKKAMHKIKDLLKDTFKFEDGKLAKKNFLSILEEVTKDFDSVLENRKNNDIYFVVTALSTAIYDAEWNNLYDTPKDIQAFKKEVAKILKQFMKYINDMTFEITKKEEVPEIKKGEECMLEPKDVQKMIDNSLKTALGLEDGQTLAEVIKTASEKSPPELVVKDADGNPVKDKDGNDVTVVGLVTKMVEELGTFKTEVSTYMTANPEPVIDPEDVEEPVEKTDEEIKAAAAL